MLTRKTPLRAKQPMARKPIKRKATRKQSTDKRWRSEAYLKWVRSLPCCDCGALNCDAHHVIGLKWGLSGMGLTAPDNYAMPLCRDCHTWMHNCPHLQQLQPRWLKATLRAGIAQFTGADAEALLHALAFVEAKECQ